MSHIDQWRDTTKPVDAILYQELATTHPAPTRSNLTILVDPHTSIAHRKPPGGFSDQLPPCWGNNPPAVLTPARACEHDGPWCPQCWAEEGGASDA